MFVRREVMTASTGSAGLRSGQNSGSVGPQPRLCERAGGERRQSIGRPQRAGTQIIGSLAVCVALNAAPALAQYITARDLPAILHPRSRLRPAADCELFGAERPANNEPHPAQLSRRHPNVNGCLRCNFNRRNGRREVRPRGEGTGTGAPSSCSAARIRTIRRSSILADPLRRRRLEATARFSLGRQLGLDAFAASASIGRADNRPAEIIPTFSERLGKRDPGISVFCG
jgi:hypothetical protein